MWRSRSCLSCGVEVNAVPDDRMNEHMFETLGIVQLACKHANFCYFLLKHTSYCCAVQCKGLTLGMGLGV